MSASSLLVFVCICSSLKPHKYQSEVFTLTGMAVPALINESHACSSPFLCCPSWRTQMFKKAADAKFQQLQQLQQQQRQQQQKNLLHRSDPYFFPCFSFEKQMCCYEAIIDRLISSFSLFSQQRVFLCHWQHLDRRNNCFVCGSFSQS